MAWMPCSSCYVADDARNVVITLCPITFYNVET